VFLDILYVLPEVGLFGTKHVVKIPYIIKIKTPYL
jgi:hypothetical protein